jgi:hypothetical protein
MRDEVVARQPLLPLVRRRGEPVRALELPQVGFGVVPLHRSKQRLETVAGWFGLARAQPGEEPASALGPDLVPAVHPPPLVARVEWPV